MACRYAGLGHVGSDYKGRTALKSYFRSEFHHIIGTAIFVSLRQGPAAGPDGSGDSGMHHTGPAKRIPVPARF